MRVPMVLLVGLMTAGAACGEAPSAADPVSVAAPPPTTTAPTAPTAPMTAGPSLRGMVLHLEDGPAGATIGDDSHCVDGGGISTEGGSDAFLDLVSAAGADAFDDCFVQIESPEMSVASLVIGFPSADLAARAMTPDGLAGIQRYYGLDCCVATSPVGAFAAADGPGDAPHEAVSPDDTIAIVAWRADALVGAVSVQLPGGATGAAVEARAAAGVQHDRMLHPIAVTEATDDDRFAGFLRSSFTAWWVGETFAAPDLPALTLASSSAAPGMVDLSYDGVHIWEFDVASVVAGDQPDQMMGVSSGLFESPCTVTESIEGPGSSVLLGRFVPDAYFGPPSSRSHDGWGDLTAGDCPVGEPNVWMGRVDVDGLVIQVNPVICYACLTPPGATSPYATPDGIRAVVAGLVPFASPAA